jgi:hypothetical protein
VNCVGARKLGVTNMTNMEWIDWLLLFMFPLAAIASLAVVGLVVVPVFFAANLVVGSLIGERRYIRHITVIVGLRGFAGLLGWGLGRLFCSAGPFFAPPCLHACC